MAALLALFLRSVRDDVRSRALFWARLGIAVAVLFVVFTANAAFTSGGAPGLAFFSTVVWMNFIVICLAGMSYFASAVTEEKEESTLGLLRMTDLSPLAILFGKSTSRLLGGFTLLLVQLPFGILAITLGGVQLGQVFRSYAILCAFLFFACNVALLASVVARRNATAGVVAALLATAYLCWPFLLSWFEFALAGWPSGISQLRQLFRPFESAFFTPGALGRVLASRGSAPEINDSIIVLLLGGAAAFIFGRLLFERFCSAETAPANPSHALRKPWKSLLSPSPGRAWPDAVAWRDFNYIHGGWKLLVLKSLLLVALWIYFGVEMARAATQYRFAEDRWWQFVCLKVFSICVLFTCLEVLFAASRIYRVERKDKTLSSLLLLPADVDSLLASKRHAVALSLLPILVVAVLTLVCGGMIPIFRSFSDTASVIGLFLFAHFGIQVAATYYLVARFSLRMNWGAFPLGVTLSFIANLIMGVLAGVLFNLGAPFVLVVVDCFIFVALKNAFRDRLVQTAGED